MEIFGLFIITAYDGFFSIVGRSSPRAVLLTLVSSLARVGACWVVCNVLDCSCCTSTISNPLVGTWIFVTIGGAFSTCLGKLDLIISALLVHVHYSSFFCFCRTSLVSLSLSAESLGFGEVILELTALL